MDNTEDICVLEGDGTPRLQLSKEQFHKVNETLLQFSEQVHANAVLFADLSGVAIAFAGEFQGADLRVLATLLAADYAASAELARLMGESGRFAVQFYEGQRQSIYITGIGQNAFILVAFDKKTTFGLVRVLTAKVREKLEQILRQEKLTVVERGAIDRQIRESVESEDFRDQLIAKLDEALCK